jgi:hypothetical protein
MTQHKKKSTDTKATDNKNAVIGAIALIVVAIIGLIGIILKIKADKEIVDKPIRSSISATLTAEAKATNQAIIQQSSTPTNTATVTLTPTLTNTPTVTPTPTPTPWPLESTIEYTDSCSFIVSDASEPGRDKAIQIQFEISDPKGYCTWVVPMNSYDARAKAALTFWVKGKVGGEKFKIGIKDQKTPAGQEPRVEETASIEWKLISVPLSEFKDKKKDLDLASLENFSLGFEYAMGSSGMIYVDDFVFTESMP